MKKAAFVAEPKQRIAKNKALAKNILRTTINGFAMAVFMRKVFSKPLLQNQCYKQ